MAETSVDAQIATILERLNQVITDHGTEAMDLALWSIRLDAILNLLFSFLFMLTTILVFKWYKQYMAWDKRNESTDFLGLICMVFYAIALVMVTTTIMNPRNWIAVYDPQLALARGLMSKLGV